jgi:hypothetical protein
MTIADKNKPDQKLVEMNKQTNADLIQNSLEKLSCTGGEQVILHLFNNPGTDRHSLSIQVIDKDLSRPSQIAISTDGRFIPPQRKHLEEFLQNRTLNCKSEKFSSVLELFPLLEAHYEKEKVKYLNK